MACEEGLGGGGGGGAWGGWWLPSFLTYFPLVTPSFHYTCSIKYHCLSYNYDKDREMMMMAIKKRDL